MDPEPCVVCYCRIPAQLRLNGFAGVFICTTLTHSALTTGYYSGEDLGWRRGITEGFATMLSVNPCCFILAETRDPPDIQKDSLYE